MRGTPHPAAVVYDSSENYSSCNVKCTVLDTLQYLIGRFENFQNRRKASMYDSKLQLPYSTYDPLSVRSKNVKM